MTTEAPTPARRRLRINRRHTIAIAIVTAIVVGGATTAAVASNQAHAAAEAQAAREADAAALEQRLVTLRTAALEQLQPLGQQLVDDATAWASSASPLLTAADVAALQSTAEAVTDVMAHTAPTGASSDALDERYDSQWRMILGARERLATIIASALTAAKGHLDAAPLADPAVRQSLVDAMTALEAAAAAHSALTEPFAAVTAAAAAADASQAAVVAAQAAAAAAEAEAAARGGYRPGGKKAGGYWTPGGTYVPPSGGGTTGGGGSTGGGGTTGEPIKSAATKAAELATQYGGSTSVAGACLALNSGHVTGSSSFGPSGTYDGYHSAVSVTRQSHPTYVNYYSVQWYACPN